MSESELRIADYVVAIEGLAMARSLFVAPDAVAERAGEVAFVLAGAGEGLLAHRMPVTRYDVEAGYTRWAPRYDGPNPAIAAETPIVRALVSALEPGIALDAACGTARHSEMLTGMGWSVIGVDATPAMLDVARAKVPGADLREGRLEALPVDDESVDLVVCALALTHVEDLAPVFAEFARVLRPDGRVVTSDMHPIVCLTGGMAGFPADDSGEGLVTTGFHYVPNLPHHAGEYVEAMTAAGLRVLGCREPRLTDEMLTAFPTYATLPDATRQAFGGLPYLLIWEAAKS